MAKVLTAREVEQLLKSGGVAAIPADAVLTPSARDSIAEFKRSGGTGTAPSKKVPISGVPCTYFSDSRSASFTQLTPSDDE